MKKEEKELENEVKTIVVAPQPPLRHPPLHPVLATSPPYRAGPTLRIPAFCWPAKERERETGGNKARRAREKKTKKKEKEKKREEVQCAYVR